MVPSPSCSKSPAYPTCREHSQLNAQVVSHCQGLMPLLFGMESAAFTMLSVLS